MSSTPDGRNGFRRVGWRSDPGRHTAAGGRVACCVVVSAMDLRCGGMRVAPNGESAGQAKARICMAGAGLARGDADVGSPARTTVPSSGGHADGCLCD